jgi:hypothetical protein
MSLGLKKSRVSTLSIWGDFSDIVWPRVGVSVQRMGRKVPFAYSKDEYLKVWQAVLGSWLGWPQHRIDSFVSRWVADMRDERSLFYQNLPLWYITPLLIQPGVRERLCPATVREIEKDLEQAIMNHDPGCTQGCDLEPARLRAVAVLQRYGATLPRRDDLAWYEEQRAAA